MRRVFSRSELRLAALARHAMVHYDPRRPRVTKWSFCGDCGVLEAEYQMQVDHVMPIIGVKETLEDLDANTLVDRIWCDINNLVPKCQSCHALKTKAENKERKEFKKGKNKK